MTGEVANAHHPWQVGRHHSCEPWGSPQAQGSTVSGNRLTNHNGTIPLRRVPCDSQHVSSISGCRLALSCQSATPGEVSNDAPCSKVLGKRFQPRHLQIPYMATRQELHEAHVLTSALLKRWPCGCTGVTGTQIAQPPGRNTHKMAPRHVKEV